MHELTCIICPIGCSIMADYDSCSVPEGIKITGNRCPRGIEYAKEEILAPKRMVTATCKIDYNNMLCPSHTQLPNRIPVKTSKPCPKEMISDLLNDIYSIKISFPVKTGFKPIINWRNTGIDVIVVRSLEVL